jgi:hypothetical protein
MRLKTYQPSGRAVKRAALGLGLITMMVYLGSYLPRRSAGGYALTQSGEFRLGGAFALIDFEQWSPEGCWWQPHFKDASRRYGTRRNSWGLFYSPLIWMDRKFSFPDRSPRHFAEKMMEIEANGKRQDQQQETPRSTGDAFGASSQIDLQSLLNSLQF